MKGLCILVATLSLTSAVHASTPPPRPPEQVTQAETAAALARLTSPDERIRTDGLDELLRNHWLAPGDVRAAASAIARKDASANARLRALLLLQRDGDEDARTVVADLKRDRSPDVRWQARHPLPEPTQEQSIKLRRKTLTLAGVDNPGRFFVHSNGGGGLSWGSFAPRGKPFEPQLLALAANVAAEPAVRLDALDILADAYRDMRAAPDATTSLARCLVDRDWRIRQAAALAIGFSRRPTMAALDALRAAVDDPIDAVGAAAAQALGEIRPPVSARARLTRTLLSALAAGLSEKRIWAATTLGAFKAKEAAGAIGQVVAADSNQEVQLNGLLALVEIGPGATAAVPHLQAILSDSKPSPKVLRQTLSTLGQIGAGAASAVPAIARLLESPTREVAEQAVVALGSIGPAADSAVPALGALFRRTAKASPVDEPLLDRIRYALREVGTERSRVEATELLELRRTQPH
jgi:HEAT repeat protein